MANTPTVFTRPVKYHADGGALLAHLAQLGLVDTVQDGSRPTNTVLLESADIASKQPPDHYRGVGCQRPDHLHGRHRHP